MHILQILRLSAKFSKCTIRMSNRRNDIMNSSTETDYSETDYSARHFLSVEIQARARRERSLAIRNAIANVPGHLRHAWRHMLAHLRALQPRMHRLG
jgi:hypothetical protein